jgi:hypothetical protein
VIFIGHEYQSASLALVQIRKILFHDDLGCEGRIEGQTIVDSSEL